MEKVGLGAVCALAIRPLSKPCNHYTTTSTKATAQSSTSAQNRNEQLKWGRTHPWQEKEKSVFSKLTIWIFQCQTPYKTVQKKTTRNKSAQGYIWSEESLGRVCCIVSRRRSRRMHRVREQGLVVACVSVTLTAAKMGGCSNPLSTVHKRQSTIYYLL